MHFVKAIVALSVAAVGLANNGGSKVEHISCVCYGASLKADREWNAAECKKVNGTLQRCESFDEDYCVTDQKTTYTEDCLKRYSDDCYVPWCYVPTPEK
ncbi:hypothetical protein B0O80DRAFT_492191 [Mortierella sp. GBAus27b]|nr:hypothetical protein BGX31_008248 [Mortierella sp. GBA43]KAI8363020.1 hypothetical protein B0O80DRAFT_492191 [Mortierella sp. GBAus27b]